MLRKVASILWLIASPLFSAQIENHPSYPTAQTPQLPLEVYSEQFAQILGTHPQLVHLARGFGFTEGPVYVAVKGKEGGYLLFTDQINDNILHAEMAWT